MFEENYIPPPYLIRIILPFVDEVRTAGYGTMFGRLGTSVMVKWHPPNAGCIKTNVDGACFITNGIMAAEGPSK